MSTERKISTAAAHVIRKQRPPLLYVLAFVFALFIGILIFTYVVTRRVNPVYVDVHGKAVPASSANAHH